jgi:N utilization substance protein B
MKSAPLPKPTEVHPNLGHKNTRREARELALRMLFELDLGRQEPNAVIASALAQSPLEGANRELAEALVRGTLAHQGEIDHTVAALSTEWALERQAAVDRNILRMSAFEMLYRPEAPLATIVNEAVELAKKYSTAESGRFVNGVLGAMSRAPRTTDTREMPEEMSKDAP